MLLVALAILPPAAAAETREVGCANRDHLELRYELILEAIDGVPPKAGPVMFAHVVPGSAIQRIEIGMQSAEDSAEHEQIPAIPAEVSAAIERLLSKRAGTRSTPRAISAS